MLYSCGTTRLLGRIPWHPERALQAVLFIYHLICMLWAVCVHVSTCNCCCRSRHSLRRVCVIMTRPLPCSRMWLPKPSQVLSSGDIACARSRASIPLSLCRLIALLFLTRLHSVATAQVVLATSFTALVADCASNRGPYGSQQWVPGPVAQQDHHHSRMVRSLCIEASSLILRPCALHSSLLTPS